MRTNLPLLFFFILWFVAQKLSAQNDFATSFENRLDSYLLNNLQNKIYVQTNSNRYVPGDTLWFKSTMVNAITHTPVHNEKMVYIDLISPDKTVLIHQVFYVFGGFSAGCLPLKPDFPFGTYHLVAYTNYMRNFSSDFYFQKKIELTKPGNTSVDWECNRRVVACSGGDSVFVNLVASTGNRKDLNGDAEVSVQLAKGNVLGANIKLLGNSGGFNFFVPDSLKLDQAILTLKTPFGNQSVERFRIELTPARPDLQFLPESGWLFPGISNKVAFKCVDGSGNAIDISGKIYDNKRELVTTFETGFQGMGSFYLFPTDSSRYEAEIEWKGKKFSYRLPAINPRAYALQLVDESDDSLWFSIAKPTNKLENMALLCHTRGQIKYFVTGNINERLTRLAVSKENFPSGITVFTLLAKKFPMAERLVYIEKDDQLNIGISTQKTNYGKREKVDVDLTITDQLGNPVVGSFCLNAYDMNAGLAIDPEENISTYLLCTSDLNGKTFDAHLFFDRQNKNHKRNLDWLMLTHGWRRFNWSDVMLNLEKEKEFPVEEHLSLSGDVRRGLNNKLVPKNFEVTVSLRQKLNVYAASTKTDSAGRFSFELPNFTDSALLIIQTKNRLGWQRDYLIDLQSNLERKNLNHLTFEKINALPFSSVVSTLSGFKSGQAGPSISGVNRLPRKDHYYFPGKDTFLIEEVEVRSDFLTKRDSLIHQTGEPDVVIESTQLQKLVEQIPWYSSIWDLLQEQVPGLLIYRAPYDEKRAKSANLVIGTVDEAVYFKVAKNTEGRLLIAVDGEFLGSRSVKLYDFLSYIDPSEIESINFIARPKKYENATFDADQDIYSSGVSFSDKSSPVGITSEINEVITGNDEDQNFSDLLGGGGAAEGRANIEYLDEMQRMMSPPSYLFITTKSKKGIFGRRPRGIANLYLQGLTNYREFYSPLYESPSLADIPDNRATLYWNPNIVTDTSSRAKVSFYTADSKTPIGLLVQGLSIDGLCGVGRLTLNQSGQQENAGMAIEPTLARNEKPEYDRLQLISGRIIDQESRMPLISANIFQSDPYYNVCCNYEGEFFIEKQQADLNKAFVVSCPGYASEVINPDQLRSGDLTIEMTGATLLPVSTGDKAREIVRDALKRSEKMYSSDQVHQGYYRETVSIDGDHYGIFESGFCYTNQDNAGNLGSMLYQTERFKNMEDRNSHKLLVLKPNHRNRFYPLNADILTMRPLFLQYNYINQFDFILIGEVMLGDDRCYKIVFDPTGEMIHPLEKGVLYIERESLALRHAEWEISPKTIQYLSYTRYLQSNPLDYNVDVSHTRYEASYLRVGEKLVLQSTKEQLEFAVNNVNRIKFERSLCVNGLSTKSKKWVKNSTYDSLVEEGKAKRMQVKEAQYQIEPWVRYGLIKPESYLMNDAKFMHDITLYR